MTDRRLAKQARVVGTEGSRRRHVIVPTVRDGDQVGRSGLLQVVEHGVHLRVVVDGAITRELNLVVRESVRRISM